MHEALSSRTGDDLRLCCLTAFVNVHRILAGSTPAICKSGGKIPRPAPIWCPTGWQLYQHIIEFLPTNGKKLASVMGEGIRAEDLSFWSRLTAYTTKWKLRIIILSSFAQTNFLASCSLFSVHPPAAWLLPAGRGRANKNAWRQERSC